jgi:[ribosomal protein S18]-alanine N-acetyltransferase
MSITLRPYQQDDFEALHQLDQSCFPPGIVYSRMTLDYFLTLPSALCDLAVEGQRIVGFILSEQNSPQAHVITLDVASEHRRQGIGSTLLVEHERNLALHHQRSVRIETAIENAVAVAFWQRHGYRIEAVLKRYYLGRLDAYEMRKILPAATTAKPAQKEP